jgi:hypothetical protein
MNQKLFAILGILNQLQYYLNLSEKEKLAIQDAIMTNSKEFRKIMSDIMGTPKPPKTKSKD